MTHEAISMWLGIASIGLSVLCLVIAAVAGVWFLFFKGGDE